MWKKSEETPEPSRPAAAPAPARPRQSASRDVATIGPSISIKGDLTGEEDLMVQGRIEGEIRLRKNSVTIGKSGRVEADVHGKRILVEGEVKGNLHGEEEIVVRASGRLQGELVAPRVTLENGCKFKGSIDMEPAAKPAPQTAVAADPKSAPSAPPAAQKNRPQGQPGAGSPQRDRVETGKNAQAKLNPTASGG